MTVKTTVNYKDDYEYEGVNASNNKVSIDMYDRDDKKALSPTEMLLTSVAACAMVDIALMLKKRRKTVIDFKADTSGERKEEHPRAFTDIHVKFIVTSPDVNEEELRKIIDLSVDKYCSVAATLKGGTNLTHSFEIKKPV
ncbi:MAG: OsmC family protein [Cyclobacteriaceae bacterium]